MTVFDVLRIVEWVAQGYVLPVWATILLCSVFYLFAHHRWFVPHSMKKLVTEHSAEVRALREQMTTLEMSKDYEIQKVQDQKSRKDDAFNDLYREFEGMGEDLTRARELIGAFGMKIHKIQTMGILFMKLIQGYDRLRGDGLRAEGWDKRINRDRKSRQLLENFLARVFGESDLAELGGYSDYSERRKKISDGEY